ncbi:MAG: bile acid:sodium symporter family protein [Chitinophagales bacterium]
MPLIDILIPLSLALIMFGVGTSLRFSDFSQIAKQPSTLRLGLILQLAFLPIMAFLTMLFLPIHAEFKVGLVLLSLCPGGATSNFIAYVLNLKTALSISLTLLNSVVILLSIPIGVNWASAYFLGQTASLQLPILPTITNIIGVTLLPVFLGMTFNHYCNATSNKLKQVIKITSALLLGLVFSIKFLAGEQSGGSGISIDDLAILLPVTLGFHLFTMLFSYQLSRWLKCDDLDAITIGIEVGLQNTALALLISSVFLSNDEVAKPALVYALFSFFTTFGFAYLAKSFYT